MRMKVANARQLILWAWESFGPKVVATSSFQTQSVPLLHLISLDCPDLPVVFIDTGFHFPETLAFRDQMAKRLGLNLLTIRAQELRPYLRDDPHECCRWHKERPLRHLLKRKDAWITGIRRDQTTGRAGVTAVQELYDRTVKVNPLFNWTQQNVLDYIYQMELPYHPLWFDGFDSIGCAPCTEPGPGRVGRWPGQDKVECGLHRMAE